MAAWWFRAVQQVAAWCAHCAPNWKAGHTKHSQYHLCRGTYWIYAWVAKLETFVFVNKGAGATQTPFLSILALAVFKFKSQKVSRKRTEWDDKCRRVVSSPSCEVMRYRSKGESSILVLKQTLYGRAWIRGLCFRRALQVCTENRLVHMCVWIS